MALLEKILHGASDRAAIERLLHIVEDELGLPLHQSVEATKCALSRAGDTDFTFESPGIALRSEVTRAAFDQWIGEDVVAIEAAVDEALNRAGISAKQVNRVFTTGGSSLVPAIQHT